VPEPVLALSDLSKTFGHLEAVKDLSLEVQRGEMVALLGPSGCGKTTTLRMVAGLERPTGGDIEFEGQTMVSISRGVYVPPDKRNTGMVFQSYALWPHMTVRENIAYPLKLRRVARKEIQTKVDYAIDLVGLHAYAGASVTRLSGGQQQRVALARALVYEPSLLLLDEPFSNLDARLREEMRVEVKLLQKRLHMTGLFVTHDQVEALSVADRVAVMNHGQIEQIGTPLDVYECPATPFVRDFLGRIVKLRARVLQSAASGAVRASLTGAPDVSMSVQRCDVEVGVDVELSIRPEEVEVLGSGCGQLPNIVDGSIEALLFVGGHYDARIRIGEATITLELPRGRDWREGQTLSLRLPETAIRVWPVSR
jgi:ABC-type Fe3+/spermidine/putrescine transport system ATPase subunit